MPKDFLSSSHFSEIKAFDRSFEGVLVLVLVLFIEELIFKDQDASNKTVKFQK